MPVLVTAPTSAVGRVLVPRLVAAGGEVRAFCDEREPVAEVRQTGAICAVGSLLAEGHLEAAMEQVHTVVHLGDGLRTDPDLILEHAATIVSAAVGARVSRVVVLSLPGAAPGASEPLRRAKGEVEDLVADAPFASVAVRASLIDTPALRRWLRTTPLTREVLNTVVAPVSADDVADAIVAIDERRDDAVEHEVVTLEGAAALPLGDWLRSIRVTPLSGVLRRRGGDPSALSALAGPWTARAAGVTT